MRYRYSRNVVCRKCCLRREISIYRSSSFIVSGDTFSTLSLCTPGKYDVNLYKMIGRTIDRPWREKDYAESTRLISNIYTARARFSRHESHWVR
jgi:hypothetical protein